jgi:hypothetical protein
LPTRIPDFIRPPGLTNSGFQVVDKGLCDLVFKFSDHVFLEFKFLILPIGGKTGGEREAFKITTNSCKIKLR